MRLLNYRRLQLVHFACIRALRELVLISDRGPEPDGGTCNNLSCSDHPGSRTGREKGVERKMATEIESVAIETTEIHVTEVLRGVKGVIATATIEAMTGTGLCRWLPLSCLLYFLCVLSLFILSFCHYQIWNPTHALHFYIQSSIF